MRRLAGEAAFSIEDDEGEGRSFVYRWPDLTVTCNEMPPQQVPHHLAGFCGYVEHIYGGEPDDRGRAILDRIRYTRLVVGVVIEPGRDADGRAEQLLGALAYGLDALLFHGNALYDKDVNLILAPDGSFDEDADVLGPVAEQVKDRVQVELPPGEPYQPTPAQAARYERVRQQLTARQVPTLSYALHIDDDDAVSLRDPAEVARRLLVLSAVAYRADGGERARAVALIDRADLWPAVSPEEKAFLEAEPADPEQARKLLWRLECLWVLAWALGDVDWNWPTGMCDVPRLIEIVQRHEADPGFIANARLRPRAEVLDAVQLTMLLHWAIRDAWIHQRPIPANLDWSGQAEMIPVGQCAAVGVVAERHHALNWLIRFGDADWDDVDTPT
jgi:hypothetical protein